MNAKTVLMLSLAVNVSLAAALVLTARSKAPHTDVTDAPNIAPATNALKRLSARAATASSVDPAAAPSQLFDWRLVESEDYRKYIANLRAIGCPEETIGDIIKADVNKLYESRRKELVGPPKKFEYWKPGAMMGATYDAERTEKERALNKEKRALLTELLGSAPDDKPDLAATVASQLEATFDFLPADKRGKVFDLMQDMQGKMQKATKGGAPDAEDIRKAMKETEAALAGILTPEEMLDYNLRHSMTANMMRAQLAGYEPTEQEFLELFKKRKAYDDEYGVSGLGVANLKGEEKERQKAAEQKLNDEIKSQLGEERYLEYKRAQDYNFQAMYRAAAGGNLGKEAAVKAYEIKKAAEDATRKLRNDNSLTKEQQAAALAGIRAETEKDIRTVFGEKVFESYQNQAYWLKTISPDPKPPAKSP